MLRDSLRPLEIQTIRIGLFVILLACIGMFIVLRYLIFPGFIHLEEQEAKQNMQRINNSIDLELQTLDIRTLDWSAWDDTVTFIETGNKEYVQSNLVGNIVEKLDLHYLQFLTLSGESRWQGSAPMISDEDVATISALNKNLLQAQSQEEEVARQVSAHMGVVAVADKLFVLSGRPIVSSTGEGPSHGMLLMGKFIDVDKLQEQTRISFTFESLTGKSLDPLTVDILQQIHTGTTHPIEKMDKENFIMHSIVKDITGRDAFLLRTNYPREISRQGIQLIKKAMLFSVVGSLVLLTILLFLLNRIILTPIHKLTVHVHSVMKTQDYRRQIGMDRKDDIGILASTFDRLLIQMGAQTTSLFEANKLLEKSSLTDALTGIANRRKFDLSFEQEWQQHLRRQEPLTMIMCDLDHFKLYNDTYGHDQGDSCLKIVAQVLSDSLHRPADLVSRYGGEEFALLLPNTDTEGGALIAANICKALIDKQIEHSSSPTSSVVTMSLGVATMIPEDKQDQDALLKSSDQALYKAKAQGRNQVCTSSHICI